MVLSKKIEVGFLLVGHTHEDIDACLSHLLKALKSKNSFILADPGSTLFKYYKYTRACTRGVLFKTSMYKMYIQETYCY